MTQKFNDKLLGKANVLFLTESCGEARPAKSIHPALEKTTNSTTKPMRNKMYEIMFGLALSMCSANADLITGVTATATTESVFRTASYLVDGSGLTGNQHGTYPNEGMWLSDATAPQSVVFDLGAVYDVSQLKIWNYNEAGDFPNPGDTLVNLGAKDVSVTYGTTLSGFTLGGATGAVASITSFSKASGLSDYTGEAFSAPFQARYVKVEINSIYGHPLNKAGLSEVQFVGTVAPEPITGVIATATTEEGFRNASYLVDGSGLTGNQHATFPNGSMWFSGATTPQAVIFDLGAVYDVSQLKVWNYNEGGDFPNPGDTLVNLGAKDVSVTYGTTLSGFTLSGVTGTIGSITSFTKASGLSNYTGETFSAPFQARYVKFNLTSIYGHPLNKVGLSEVQFVGTAAPGPNASYGSWASLNAGNGNPDEDFDKDGMSNGVEFFMGQTGSSFTPNPPLVGGKVSWAKNPAALASYVVQTSSNLRDELVSGDGGWAPVASGVVDNGTSVEYTVPAGDPKRFTRLKVTVTP